MSVKLLRIIQEIKPDLIEGMDAILEGQLDDEDFDEDEGNLIIEGEAARGARTVFADRLPEGFTKNIKNILALTASFKWKKILEWKRIQDDFDHEDQELQVLVAAEGAIRQVFEQNFKVTKIKTIKTDKYIYHENFS